MHSKVIVQLVSLIIIALFLSGFAENNTVDESTNELISSLRRDGIIPTRSSDGDVIRQRSLPRNFCLVSGWTRVVSFDASSGECPNNFTLDSTGSGTRICRGDITPPAGIVSSQANFSIRSSLSFTKVAGFVEGYQFGSPDAFSRSRTLGGMVDGIIFSYGNSSSQNFLWAYAAGDADKKNEGNCPCSTVPGDAAPSEFGRFHYCDTGNFGNSSEYRWYTDKVLWSGEGCPTTSTCCNHLNLPYFCRTDLDLQQTRNTDRFTITMRLNGPTSFEDIGITKFEIYVA